jgi:hypothetical protein
MLLAGRRNQGSSSALKKMQDVRWVCDFEKPKGNPAFYKTHNSCPVTYLKFGCLSRPIHHTEVYKAGSTRSRRLRCPGPTPLARVLLRQRSSSAQLREGVVLDALCG